MGYNVVKLGNDVLIDISRDTVNPAVLLKGYTAHNAAGDLIEGTLEVGSSRLPGGYTELEYIESHEDVIYTGQYIDTGVIPSSNDFSIVMKVSARVIDEENWFLTINRSMPEGTATYLQFGVRGNSTFATHLTYVVIDGSTPSTSDIVDINFSVHGSTATQSGDANHTLTNSAFQSGSYRNSSITILNGNWRCYKCQIYLANVLVRDFIPCMNPSGEYGLYDLVNAEFYGNAGTGVFTGKVKENAGGGNTEQATPVISVSANGLITAVAGSKSATKQLTTKGATTITPTSSVQTAVSAGTYVTGDIKVAAASGGGKTGWFVGAETQTRTIDVGVTLSNSDKFFLYCAASTTSYVYAVIDVWCLGSSDTNLRYTNSTGELQNPEYDGVTYSGSKITITSKMGYFKSGLVYNWMLLQG